MESWLPTESMPDLRGKIAVVTGGSTGLGLHLVKHLASKGAKVYFTSRSQAKTRTTVEAIKKLQPDIHEGRLIGLALDLANMESVVRAANELKSKETKIDLFFGNGGGAIHDPYIITKGGWDINMATNYVGHVLFVNLILPLLKAAAAEPNADVRIIMTSSNAIAFFVPPGYDPKLTTEKSLALDRIPLPWKWRFGLRHIFVVDMFRYALSKLALSMFTTELQHRLDAENIPIICTSLNPGAVLSDDVLNIFVPFLRPLMKGNYISPDEGSFHSLFAATSDKIRMEPEKYKGQYVEPMGQIQTPHKVIHEQTQLTALWNVTMSSIERNLSEGGLGKMQSW